jgi:Mrp family chromosome partitioning ATPase
MRLLLAARDLAVEPAIVQAAPDVGLHVVRRCLDTADLIAAAEMESDIPITVSMRFPRIGSDVIRALGRRRIIALVGDDQDEERARQWGIGETIRADLPGAQIAQQIRHVLAGGVWSVPVSKVPSGTVITITSAVGAPGRTRLAVALAQASPMATCLIDADTRAPAVAQRLGIYDDISGLALAVRHLNNGTLTETTLRSATARVDDHRFLLTGCTEASDMNVGEVVGTAAHTFDRVIVDTPPITENTANLPIAPGIAERVAVVFVMTPDDVSITRTIRLLIDRQVPGALIAVHGIRRRSKLRELGALLIAQGIDIPLVLAGDVRKLSQRLQSNGPNMREHIRSTRREG